MPPPRVQVSYRHLPASALDKLKDCHFPPGFVPMEKVIEFIPACPTPSLKSLTDDIFLFQ
jgi:hypothetical protein